MSFSDLCSRGNYIECYVAVVLWKIFTPLLLVVGIGGNFFSMAVLSRQRLCHTTTSVYLRMLAVVDTAVLLVAIPPKVATYYASVVFKSMGAFPCKFYSWLNPSLTTLSLWLMPVITLDRFIQVKYPIWAKNHSTRRSAGIVVTVLTIFVLNAHVLAGLTAMVAPSSANSSNATVPLKLKCSPISEWYDRFYWTIWPIIILSVHCLMPVTFQIACNVILIRNLARRSRQNRNRKALNARHEREQRDLISVTKMLIVVCVFFVVSSVPMCIRLILMSHIFDMSSQHDVAKRLLLQCIVQLCMYSNNSINFLLYTLSGRVFRNELRSMLEHARRPILRWFNKRLYPTETTDMWDF